MAATYNKFQCFVEDLLNGKHSLFESGSDALFIYLSNATPSASADFVMADCAEIAAGNGYSAGGEDTNQESSRSGGTVTVKGTKVVWTASSGTIGPFQYVILYNQTLSEGALIAWWDYLTPLTLQDGETFTVKFNSADPIGTIFTLA